MIYTFRREMRVEQGKLEIYASKVGKKNRTIIVRLTSFLRKTIGFPVVLKLLLLFQLQLRLHLQLLLWLSFRQVWR